MTGRGRAAVGVAGALVVLAVVLGARQVAADGESPESSWEDPALADPELAAAALARARARLVDGTAPADPRLVGDGHGALWVCAYAPPSAPVCAAGTGEDTASSVDGAIDDLRRRGAHPQGRLKLDWQTARLPGRWPTARDRHAAGTVGFAVGDAVVLPSEVLERDLLREEGDDEDDLEWDRAAIGALLRSRGAPDDGPPTEFVRTTSWVETGDGGVVRTYRVHAWEYPRLDAADLEQRARAAADALTTSVDAAGRIRYRWDVSAGEEKSGSNLLRHAGSTWALLQAYQRFGDPRYRDASERAIRWLLERTDVDERGRYVVEGGSYVKLGGAALALLAVTRWQEATGDARWNGEARELATFLVGQQRDSGEFVYFPPRRVGGTGKDGTSDYYPGEAVIALASFATLDPDPRWLAVARRGADWLIDVRDAGKGPEVLAADHWLSYGLAELYRQTRDERYADHGLRIAAAIEAQRRRQAGHERFHRDYLGGYYEPPRATPASTRAEALVGILDLCRAAERACDGVPALLASTLRHAVQSQYRPELAWWFPEPEQVVGSVGGGVLSPDTRNDFTQHALSALLGAERLGVVDIGGGVQ